MGKSTLSIPKVYGLIDSIWTDEMILTLAGQFKELSHMHLKNSRDSNGIRTHDLYDAGAVLSPTELWSHTVESRSICWAHACFPVKGMNEWNDYEVLKFIQTLYELLNMACKNRSWVLSPPSSHSSSLASSCISTFVSGSSTSSSVISHSSGNASFSFRQKLWSVQQATTIWSTLHVAMSTCLDIRRNLPFSWPNAFSIMILVELWVRLNCNWSGLKLVPAYGTNNQGNLGYALSPRITSGRSRCVLLRYLQ